MFNALPESDPRWEQMKGGYRILFNPVPALKILQENPASEEAWRDLWENLHHQNDVGEASYAAAVVLIGMRRDGVRFDWNFPGLISLIEMRRGKDKNPPLPPWLEVDYRAAWAGILPMLFEDIAALTTEEPFALRALLAAVALAKGASQLGTFLITIDESEISGYFDGVWPQ
jgi:hypothetical protein